MMPIPYILVLLLFIHTHSQCPARLYNTNLTTDLLQLSPSGQPSTVYSYTFKAPFQQIPKVSIAITQLSNNGQDALRNPFFYVSVMNVNKGGMHIQTYFQNQKWTISKLTLISGHNTQLVLGSTTLRTYFLSQENSKSTSGSLTTRLSFQISINTTLPVNNNQISRAFINGFSITDTFTTVSIVNTSMVRGGKINFSVDVVAGDLQILWVSFVVFNLNNGEFSAYGGYTVVNHNASDTVDLLKGFSAGQNPFFGINNLQSNPQSNIGISVDIDSNFLMKYASSSGNFVIAYIFIGYASNQVCASCQGNSFYQDGRCMGQCSGNSILVNLANGGRMCRSCPADTGLIAVNGVCVCPVNSQFVNNKCVQSLAGLNVQMGQNLAIKPTSLGTSSASNGVINIISDQGINQNSNFASPLPSQSTTTQADMRTMSISSPSSSQNLVSSSGAQTLSTSSTQGTSSSSIGSSFIPPTVLPGQTATSHSIGGIVSSGAGGEISLPRISSTSTNCPIPNSYFNGNQCVCKVSYVYQNGNCIFPQVPTFIIPTAYVPPSNSSVTCQQNASYNGTNCVCNPNYYLFNNLCIKCQANSQWNGYSCICNNNYYNLNGQCVLQKTTTCPQNSVDNGLGICICHIGFTMINNQCTLNNNNCPPNSTFANNFCTCNKGFFNISGTCSQCPSGAFWSTPSQRCVYVCGVNSFYNTTVGNCTCVPSFGFGSSGTCQQCSSNYYLSNGYCVTCPVNSLYNNSAKECFCLAGFILSAQGICVAKCKSNQMYNQATTFCDCIVNFTRVGSACVPCDYNSYYISNQCFACPPNSLANSNGQCICTQGFIADTKGVCVPCLELSNTFLMNGFCVTCPNNQIYNTNTQLCGCPLGKTLQGNLCVQNCRNDEILDSKGNCYSCGMNQVISNGVCVCESGYISNDCGGCILNCQRGYFPFLGRCAICPMNMNFLQQITGCVCPNGYYMDPLSNVCKKSSFIAPICSNGMFYDNIGQKCTTCPLGCSSCLSSTNCSSCQVGFSLLINGFCRAICGDGLIRGNQMCDGSNQAGCVNCIISQGYNCTGQPSVCFIVQTIFPPIVNPVTPPAPPLALFGNVSLNSNNIFLTLQTNPPFKFPNPTAMKDFIKCTFYGSRPTSYCMQRQANPSLFDCLLIYPSGIPNNKFKVLFSYSYQGNVGNTTVTIDPLKSLTTRK